MWTNILQLLVHIILFLVRYGLVVVGLEPAAERKRERNSEIKHYNKLFQLKNCFYYVPLIADVGLFTMNPFIIK